MSQVRIRQNRRKQPKDLESIPSTPTRGGLAAKSHRGNAGTRKAKPTNAAVPDVPETDPAEASTKKGWLGLVSLLSMPVREANQLVNLRSSVNPPWPESTSAINPNFSDQKVSGGAICSGTRGCFEVATPKLCHVSQFMQGMFLLLQFRALA